jgi:transcriptional regulator with XRE-family HTH domain
MEIIYRTARLVAGARARAGLSQRELADRAGTAQPVVARIEGGQANPTVETLERLLDAAGFTLAFELVPKAAADRVVEAYKKDVDRTLLRENLGKTPEQRVRALADLQRFGHEVRRAVRAVKRRP